METLETISQFRLRKRLKRLTTDVLRFSCYADIRKCKLSIIALSAGEERQRGVGKCRKMEKSGRKRVSEESREGVKEKMVE